MKLEWNRFAFNTHNSHIKGQEANTSVFLPHGKSASFNDDTRVIQCNITIC